MSVTAERTTGCLETAVPDRSLVQRMAALEWANEVRCRRAQLKRDLKAGRVQVVPLLTDPPDWLASMRVMDLLLATPKRGQVKVNRALNRAGVVPAKAVGALSERQRVALLRHLGGVR